MEVQKPKTYSWAGHCWFKVIDSDSDDENEYDESNHKEENIDEEGKKDEEEGSASRNDNDLNSDFYQKIDIRNQLKQRKPRYDKGSAKVDRLPRQTPKPLKAVSVYLRNNTILAKTRVKNPKYVYLYSHPLHSISKSSAKTLKRVKSLKLLSLTDYGYTVYKPFDHDIDSKVVNVDLEEANISDINTEELLRNELDYLLSTTNSLRKFYVILRCRTPAIFKRLHTYARRQKGLQKFGFIMDTFTYRYGSGTYKCDLSPLRPTLQKLEIWHDKTPHIQIRGLSTLYKVTKYVCGTTCGGFPREICGFDEERGNEPTYLCWLHVDLISEMLLVPGLKSVMITNFEMEFDKGFWKSLILRFEDRPDVRLAYRALAESNVLGRGREIRNDIQSILSNYKGRTIDFMILADYRLVETSFRGGGLRTSKFNFDKQYLHEIKKFEIFKTLKGDGEFEDDSYNGPGFDDKLRTEGFGICKCIFCVPI